MGILLYVIWLEIEGFQQHSWEIRREYKIVGCRYMEGRLRSAFHHLTETLE